MYKHTTIRQKCSSFVRLYKFGNKYILLPNLYFLAVVFQFVCLKPVDFTMPLQS